MRSLFAFLLAVALAASPALADKKVDDAVAKAEEQLQKGKPEDALKTLNKLVDQNPGNPEALLALARLQERLGNLDEAGATLENARAAAAVAPPALSSQVLTAAAHMALLQGSGKDALESASKAVELDASPAALAALALAQVRTLDPGGALKTAEKAVAAGPSSAEAHEARGAALLALGRAGEAGAELRKALQLDAKLNRARIRLASALLAEGKKAEAVAEARSATEADPRSGTAFAVLGTAILAENPKNWNEAIAQAQQGAFLNPRSPAVQVAVGELFVAAGNFDQAANAFRRALETDPGFGPARLALVQAQVARGDKDAALQDARRLATDMPTNGQAQRLLGELLLRSNEYADAATALEKAVALIPGDAEAYALLGRAYQFTRRSEDAAGAYEKAVKLDPANLEYRTTWGLLLGIIGQHQAGIAELKKVIATPGYNDSDAYVNMGWIYRNMKPSRTDESIAAYKKAFQINPREVQAALGLGWAYSYTRLWEEAIAAFKKAVELEPKIAGEAYDGMAWSYFFKKDLPQARAYLQKAEGKGRADARLKENIDRLEKAIAAGVAATEEALREAETQREAERQRMERFERLDEDMRSRSPAVRARAAADLARLVGADAVPALTYLLQDKDYGVRTAAAQALGSLGPAARSALPYLKAILNAPRNESITMSREEMEEMLKDEDLRKVVRDAVLRIERR